MLRASVDLGEDTGKTWVKPPISVDFNYVYEQWSDCQVFEGV